MKSGNTYVILFCHKIQFIISTELNELFYAWATLGVVGLTRNCMRMSILPKKKNIFRMKLIFILGLISFCVSENPPVVLQKPIHPLRVTVWYGMWSGGIIDQYFIENEDGAIYLWCVFLYPLLIVLMWTMFSFNRNMHAISIFCIKHFMLI